MQRNNDGDSESVADQLERSLRARRERMRQTNGAGEHGSSIMSQMSAQPMIQERAIEQMESILRSPAQTNPREVADVTRQPHELTELKQAVVRLDADLSRLSKEVSRLALAVAGRSGQPEKRSPVEAAPIKSQMVSRRTKPAPAVATDEPQFQPGKATRVIFASVPDFDVLMEVQQGLSGLSQAEGVAVNEYENGEASVDMMLRSPVTLRQILKQLRGASGHHFLVEEAQADERRLRLRFIDQESRAGGLRTDLWPKA